jgi:hypothetical protein
MVTRLVAASVALLNLAWIGLLAWRLWVVPENHWAWDQRGVVTILAVELGLIWVSRGWWRGCELALVAAPAMVGLGLTLATLEFNGLLPYNLWIQRGMPLKWGDALR